MAEATTSLRLIADILWLIAGLGHQMSPRRCEAQIPLDISQIGGASACL
jgi:hypothetical protein